MSDAPLSDAERDDALEDQDEIDVELRSPVRVRTRVLILAAILRRLAQENVAAGAGDNEPIAEAFDEREWLREQGLARELTPREVELFNSPPGSLGAETIIEASWQGEALVVLAWAIGALEMPPIDTISDPRPVMDLIPRPWDAVHNWLSDPNMVTEPDAVRQRERADIWHWRVTIELLRRGASAADRQDFEAAIREVVAEALRAGVVTTLRD